MSGFGYAFVNALRFTIISVCILMPAWRIISAWLLERSIGVWTALPALTILLGLLGGCWYVGGAEWALILAILLTITNLLFPWFNKWLDRAAISRMCSEDMNKYRQTIERDPTNAAAHEFLADALMERRRYTEAIAEYEIVVSLTKKSNTHERWKLQRAIAAKERQAYQSVVACEKCDAVSPAGTGICPICGSPLKRSLWSRFTNLKSTSRDGQNHVTPLLRNMAMLLPVLFIIFSPLSSSAKIWILFLGAIVGGYLLLKRAGGD